MSIVELHFFEVFFIKPIDNRILLMYSKYANSNKLQIGGFETANG